MHESEALVVFVRLPVLGKVKTRIAATIGEAHALEIYKALLSSTIATAAKLQTPVFLFYEGGLPPLAERDHRFHYRQQTSGNLDTKIIDALTAILNDYEKVVIVVSDCPALSPSIIRNSFGLLDSHQFVLGPATDGGFYLLGCKHITPDLLNNISWSTSSVLTDISTNIRNAGHSLFLLEELSDIDTETDWKLYNEEKGLIEKG